MDKKTTAIPVTAPIEPQTLRIPEAAIYVGCTNFFMEELLRHDEIPWIMMGDHKVVYREDLDKWLVEFKRTQLRRRSVGTETNSNGNQAEPDLKPSGNILTPDLEMQYLDFITEISKKKFESR